MRVTRFDRLSWTLKCSFWRREEGYRCRNVITGSADIEAGHVQLVAVGEHPLHLLPLRHAICLARWVGLRASLSELVGDIFGGDASLREADVIRELQGRQAPLCGWLAADCFGGDSGGPSAPGSKAGLSNLGVMWYRTILGVCLLIWRE